MSESLQNLDPETVEMIQAFVSEAIDSLDNNEPIVELLREEDNSEHINSIFRVFHTLKGLSGFFEMYVINKVTHEAETLLDVMRKQNRKQSEESITVIYSAFDFLRDLLQRVNVNFTDKDADDDAQDMILIIKDALGKVLNPLLSEDSFDNFASHADDSGLSPEDAFMMETGGSLSPEDAFMMESSGAPSPEDEFLMEHPSTIDDDDDAVNMESYVSNDLMDQYLTSAGELLDMTENNLLVLEQEPKNYELVGNTFGAVHSLKGNSGFMGLSEVEEISMEMESILDSVRSKDLEIDTTIISILLSNVETIRNRISKLGGKQSLSQSYSSDAESTEIIAIPENSKQSVATDIDLSIDFNLDEDDFDNVTAFPEHVEVQPTTSDSQIVEPQVETAKQAVSKVQAKSEAPQAKRTTPPPAMAKKDIRVETSKIDKLFDLVGELITIETMVTNSPDIQGLQLPNFLKSANMLNKITRELQEITMSVRMMPLESMFNKMKRLVRDVSIKMNKKINFEISGQETEMDKNVIDEIADPLVHILRNAIDHGIESPQARLDKGKPEIGSLSLKARYEGNEILIIVKDDGAGIDRDRILKKAEERGMLTMPGDKMSDKEVFLLLFEPGFSTAEKLTDISGRGVGMDVVKKNIEKLHGSVDVVSKLGEGSTFTLRIPLTLAIMEAMLIRVGSARYALPLLAVTESFRVVPNMISKTMDGLEVCNLRNEVLTVVRLHELFHVEPDSSDLDKGILIIIESREKQVALFADEIVGQQQAVIKGLSDYIGKVQGITGCMILGDGGIGLIIDIESLIELSENIALM